VRLAARGAFLAQRVCDPRGRHGDQVLHRHRRTAGLQSSQEEAYYQYYKEGDYFGEYALITKKPRQVSILAVTQCRLVSLSSRVFLNVINHDKANL
jgi:CRP-like cAMP-binding protein